MIIRNWKEVTPYIGHESAIIWPIFREHGTSDLGSNEAPLQGFASFTQHMMQGGRSGDYHDHDDVEQVYYFLKGRGEMKINGQMYRVKEGDAVHIPPKVKHQLINDSEQWIEHLIVTAKVPQK